MMLPKRIAYLGEVVAIMIDAQLNKSDYRRISSHKRNHSLTGVYFLKHVVYNIFGVNFRESIFLYAVIV